MKITNVLDISGNLSNTYIGLIIIAAIFITIYVTVHLIFKRKLARLKTQILCYIPEEKADEK